MARSINRLTARAVTTLKTPGRHADGGGLYLQVDPSLAKRWVFVFQWRGQRKEMGLGSAATVPLADAREGALAARRTVVAGTNPIEARKSEEQGKTFGDVADEMLASLLPAMSNAKHQAQWSTALKKGALRLRPMPVSDVATPDVLAVLQPIWNRTPETASRLRGRIERVLDAAKAKGLRTGENPARWRGHLDLLLPKRQRLTRGHHAALPFAEVAVVIERLRHRPAVAARALEFTILTAARTGETLGMRWSEVDLQGGVWTVPASRMKARIEHRVPLAPRAIAILEEVRPLRDAAQDGLVFPGQAKGRPLSQMSMMMLLRRMELDGITVHGFRSTFRDWAGDCTNFARETVEAALAHTVGNAVERAYRRSDAFDKRRRLMEAWAGYCGRIASRDVTEKQAA
jgi:integrase